MAYTKIKNKLSWRKQYYVAYSVLFFFAVMTVFAWFFLTGRTLIWKEDGWTQHYKALLYYAKYLRQILRDLFVRHQLVIPSWDFSIGEGSDILRTFHYYVIGDPFAVLSVLFPSRYMYICYELLVLLRLYVAGIVFSELCFYMGKYSRYAVLSGTLAYLFGDWAIYNCARHPYFLNPMIYLPLLVMGVEKIMKKERPYVFIAAVFLSGISNFYFFYMLVLMTVLYVGLRLVISYRRRIKDGILGVGRIAVAAVIGGMMSAVILLPVVFAFLSDIRMGGKHATPLFYNLGYYSVLPKLFLSEGNVKWLCMGYAAPVLLAVALLFFQRKKYVFLKSLLIAGLVIIAFPVLGRALNGFAYVSNRWCFAFALVLAYILTEMWPQLLCLKSSDGKKLLCFIVGYFLLCMLLPYQKTVNVFISLFLAVVFFVILLMMAEKSNWKLARSMGQKALLLILMLSIICNSYWKFSPDGSDYASECVTVSRAKDGLLENEVSAIQEIAESEGEDGFYRYSGSELEFNAGMFLGMSSTQYYWSLLNPNIASFRQEMEMRESSIYVYKGYDERASLLSLACVKYWAEKEDDMTPPPYGFVYVDTVDVREKAENEAMNALKKELGVESLSERQIQYIIDAEKCRYKIYKNQFALPLSYSYKEYLPMGEWERLSAVQKQETMLDTIVIDGYDGKIKKGEPSDLPKERNCKIKYLSGKVVLEDGSFVVLSPGAQVEVCFDGKKKSETYFQIKGLSFQSIKEYDLYFGSKRIDPFELYNKIDWKRLPFSSRFFMKRRYFLDAESEDTLLRLGTSNNTTKGIRYYTEQSQLFNDRHDYTVNLSYSEKAVDSITITFDKIGTYSYDSIQVCCQPVKKIKKLVQRRKKDKMQDVSIRTDCVEGTVSMAEPKLLCLSIPFSDGWHAYVDGKETKLYRANVMYMAIEMGQGTHHVRLEYKTPWLKMGGYVSLISIILFILLSFLMERKAYGKLQSRQKQQHEKGNGKSV